MKVNLKGSLHLYLTGISVVLGILFYGGGSVGMGNLAIVFGILVLLNTFVFLSFGIEVSKQFPS